MQFEFKGQTYEVNEDNVIFTVDNNDNIAGIEFREHVKVKPRWQVMLTTRRGSVMPDPELLYESDDYNACHDVFVLEKHRLVEQLIMTDDAYRLKVSYSNTPTYTTFCITDGNKAVEYYLKLTKSQKC